MKKKANLTISEEEKTRLIHMLVELLPALRAKVGITQSELAQIVGLTRQTISMVESGKRPMSWPTYLSLMFFFDYNTSTHQMIRDVSVFPKDLIWQFNR